MSEESPKKRRAETDPIAAFNEEQAKRYRSDEEPKRKSWDQRFYELKQYIVEHGDTLVPQKYAANPKLGRCKCNIYSCIIL